MENQELKEYLLDFAENKLNSCQLFVDVFGKTYVRERLEKNLDKVYTKIVSRTYVGRYNVNTGCIKLYSQDINKPLTIQDIKENKQLQQAVLHELVHAIFRRTKEECVAYGIKSGTGIAENYNNGHELGRGLNEGLTEWLVEKAGYEHRVYDCEVNIVKMLELAVGEQNIMRLANGNIIENAPKLLGMSMQESMQLLAEVDAIYIQEKKLDSLMRIKKELEKLHNNSITEQDKTMLAENLGEDYKKYVELMDRMKVSLGDDYAPDDIDKQLQYVDSKINYETTILDQDIAFTEKIIFDKYFKKEIEDAIYSEDISEQTMKRLDKLYELIHVGTTLEGTSKDTLPIRFKSEIYDKLFEKHLDTIRKQYREQDIKEANQGILGKVKQIFNRVFNMKTKQQVLPGEVTNKTAKIKKKKNEFPQHLSKMVEPNPVFNNNKSVLIEENEIDTIDVN